MSHPLDPLYLRHKRKVVVEAGADQLRRAYVATVLKNLERLGYTCSPALISRLQTLSELGLAVIYRTMIDTLTKLKGAHVAWDPMYPNFPRQVMETSEAELYINALLHYFGDWVGARILPIYAKEPRPPVEAVELEVIDLGSEDDLRTMTRDLIGAATSISGQDKQDVATLVAYFAADIGAVLPREIPHKENLASLRFFLWWREGKDTGRVDIDLTAAMYDERFQYREHISWTQLRSAKYRGAHSGDITSAPKGACEFIDLDLASVLAYGCRYIVVIAYSFTAQPFSDLPECFIGWMMRNEPGSGEIFEPATVVDRVDLAGEERCAVPAIFDLATRQLIWTDVVRASQPNAVAAIETNRSSLGQLVQAMAVMHKTSLARLFGLHADARGTRVDRPDAADTIFSVDRGVTPQDHEAIMAKYLA